MILQTEDCIDCLKVILDERYEFGFLGPYHNLLNPLMISVGQEQTFVYSSPKDIANGPFYLTDEERETKRNDKLVSIDGELH